MNETEPRRKPGGVAATIWTVALVPALGIAALALVSLPALQQCRYERQIAGKFRRLGGEVRWLADLPWERLRGFGLCRSLYSRPFAITLDGSAVADEDLAALAELTGVQVLSLRATSIGDEGLKHVAHLENLRLLVLSRTNVTDAGLAHVSGLTNLWALWLSDTAITDEGLAHLGPLTSLRELNLDGTTVEGPGLAALSGIAGLHILHVPHRQAVLEQAEALRKTLPGLSVHSSPPIVLPKRRTWDDILASIDQAAARRASAGRSEGAGRQEPTPTGMPSAGE
jgi:hypothetical protein